MSGCTPLTPDPSPAEGRGEFRTDCQGEFAHPPIFSFSPLREKVAEVTRPDEGF